MSFAVNCSGMIASIGLDNMSSNFGNSFSNDKKANISAQADSPIVPERAVLTELSVRISLLSTITLAFSSERGDTNDN